MNTSRILHLNIGMLALLISTCVQAYPEESIVLDPATGNYTITYRSSDPEETRLMQTEFVPSTKIVPTIRSAFRANERNAVVYRYTVSNGATAKQGIDIVGIHNVVNPIVGEIAFPHGSKNMAEFDAYDAAEKAATPSPNGWHGGISRTPSESYPFDRVYWGFDHGTGSASDGIKPGSTLSGFGFASLDLPGAGEAHLVGVGAMFGYPDEGPAEDSAISVELERLRDNDFVSKLAAVPTIVVPVPFDAAVLLDRIRTHVATWPGKQLLDPAFAAQLDRYLVGAADAYRSNQAKAGKQNLETLRAMLKREHKGLDHEDGENENGQRAEKNDGPKAGSQRILIDRLAARILDFDLKYVLKRMDKD